jgi:LDH2 family malate/lactate/ureidoglycolate dehydrogenase
MKLNSLTKALPENAWIGPDGETTTDPDKWEVSDYIMMPFGAHKGFGLGMIMETLTSMLAGAHFQDHFNGLTETCHVFAAMRIDAFTDLEVYRRGQGGSVALQKVPYARNLKRLGPRNAGGEERRWGSA